MPFCVVWPTPNLSSPIRVPVRWQTPYTGLDGTSCRLGRSSQLAPITAASSSHSDPSVPQYISGDFLQPSWSGSTLGIRKSPLHSLHLGACSPLFPPPSLAKNQLGRPLAFLSRPNAISSAYSLPTSPRSSLPVEAASSDRSDLPPHVSTLFPEVGCPTFLLPSHWTEKL